MQTIKDYSAGILQQAAALGAEPMKLTPETVYTEGHQELLPYVHSIVEGLALPGSGISGFENLVRLLELARAGHSSLLMVEHYSNFDLPELYYFLEQEGPRGKALQKAIVAIAGMKLTTENSAIAAFASIYSRIVICPSRAIAHLDAEKDKDTLLFINSINRAAARALSEIKKRGKIILVYPSGTRYRPWAPDSKRGVREIDSYVKGFDYMCFVSKTGLIMHVQQETEDDMLTDHLIPDVVRFTVSEPVPCAAFREAVRASLPEDADKKQAVADAIMERLETMHNAPVSP